MIKILTASFKSINGVEHSIKIYDNDLTGEDLETSAILEAPGYVLDTNAGITDVMKGGIIESSVSFTLRNQDNVLADLIEGLSTIPEGRYLIQIDRGGSPFWRGILLSDFSNREDLPEGGYSFTATDGMAMLGKVYVSTTNPPEGGSVMESLLITMIKGLRQIPSINLWNTGSDNKFLYARTDWYGQNMNEEADPLYQVYFKGTAMWQKVTEKEGYNGVITKVVEPLTYREMLQHVMERFNAFLIMNEGAWYITQRDLLAEVSVTFFTYRAFPLGITSIWSGTPYQVSKTTVAGVMPNAPVPDKRWRSNGEFSMLPALSKVSVIYGGGNLADGFDSIIPPGFVPETTYTTMPLDSGEGNYLHMRVKFRENYLIDWADGPIPQHDFKATVYYKILVKQGDYYLKANGEWNLTPDIASYLITPVSTLRHSWNNTEGQYVVQDWVEVDWEKFSKDLPLDDTEVTIKLFRSHIFVHYGSAYFTVDINEHFLFTPDLENHFVMYIVDNDGPVTYVSFEAENDTEGFLNEYELSPSLFGTARVIQNSNFSSYSSGGWAITELWGKGYLNDKDKYFNALLVHEMLGNQGKNLLMFSGDIYDRESTQMTPLMGIGIFYEPEVFADVYLLAPNKVSYYAQEEKWAGDWVETFHLEVMPPAPLPDIKPWVWLSPSSHLSMDLTLLPLIVDGGTGQIDTTGGGGTGTGVLGGVITTPAIRTVQSDTPLIPTTGLISIQPNLKGELKQTDEFGNTKTIGADAAVTEMDLRGVTIVGGFLYNWLVTQEATLISTAGWAVPTYTNVETLLAYLIASGFNYDDTTTGNKLGKSVTVATGWATSATAGAVGNTDYPAKRNITGLSIKATGGRLEDGAYDDTIYTSTIWTSTEGNATLGRSLSVINTQVGFNHSLSEKEAGYGIRLFRAATVGEQALADGTAIVDAYTGNDGKVYQGVKLGTQIWLSENLAETKYSDGTEIPLCEPAEIWAALTVPRRCAYDNDIDEAYTDSGDIIFKDGKTMPADQISYNGTTVKDTLDGLLVSNSYKIISTAYTLLSTDSNVEISANTFDVTLPTSVGRAGKKYTIINAGTGVVTLKPNGAETISGDAEFSLNQWDTLTIISNGSNWRII